MEESCEYIRSHWDNRPKEKENALKGINRIITNFNKRQENSELLSKNRDEIGLLSEKKREIVEICQQLESDAKHPMKQMAKAILIDTAIIIAGVILPILGFGICIASAALISNPGFFILGAIGMTFGCAYIASGFGFGGYGALRLYRDLTRPTADVLLSEKSQEMMSIIQKIQHFEETNKNIENANREISRWLVDNLQDLKGMLTQEQIRVKNPQVLRDIRRAVEDQLEIEFGGLEIDRQVSGSDPLNFQE